MVVLFDLDGTLTDPFEGISRSVAYALERLGLPALDVAQQRAFIGPPLQDGFAALGLDEARAWQAVHFYRERYADIGLRENRVYDGIPALLAALTGQRVRLCVATSKPTVFAEKILEHFGLAPFFETVSGASLDGALRHKGEIITVALAALGEDAAPAVMVGDRAQDVRGAKAARVASIGVRWGFAEPGELEEAGADRIVDTVQGLYAALQVGAGTR